MTPRAGDPRAGIGPLGRVIEGLFAPVVIAVVAIAFALHLTRKRWEQVALWGLQLCLLVLPFVLASFRVISTIEFVALEIVAFAVLPRASRLSDRLEPRVVSRQHARWAREDLAWERNRLSARALLEQELAIPRRVLAAPNGFVVVEGGYILDSTPVPNLPESVRARFASELTRVVAGRHITARLVDDFMLRYVPNGFSSGLEKVRLGPGYRHGMIPVDLVIDGQVLVWKETGFVLGESAIAPGG
jgi:lysylphosphatidylglycerol synthetase-like protein (DUF2156 family)